MLKALLPITISRQDPESKIARELLEELSAQLAAITGASGKSSFDVTDVRSPNACFVVAWDAAGQPLGCGGFRPVEAGIAEIKRMYARVGSQGVGAAILAFLEAEAVRLGYHTLWLETRRVNERAICFYEKHGYHQRPNYGKYVGRQEAVCFEKHLKSVSRQSSVVRSQ